MVLGSYVEFKNVGTGVDVVRLDEVLRKLISPSTNSTQSFEKKEAIAHLDIDEADLPG